MQKIVLVGTILIILLFGNYGCGLRPEGDAFHFIALGGIVSDVETNMPVYNAWIDKLDTIPPYSAITDSNGVYVITFENTATHDVHIYCGKEGYIAFDTVVTIPTNVSLEDTLDIYLLPE